MKLTHRTEYALLALVLLARKFGQGVLKGDTIAEEQNIPKRFLQQILFTLKRAGYVQAVKGKDGGYALNKTPDQITLAEIIRHFEGPLASVSSVSKNFYHPSPIESERQVVKVLSGIRDHVATILENTTLEDMVGSKSDSLKRRRKRAR